jgi:hypothetical protein
MTPSETSTSTKTPALGQLSDAELVLLRAGLDAEMRKRSIAFSVGGVGERLVIDYFRKTPGLPKLSPASRGTKNVDANSNGGERYSIKTVCHAKKTGTIYPDSGDRNKQLFEYILIAKLAEDWSLKSIHQLSWADFVKIRSWDKRMNAWYIGYSASKLALAKQLFPKTGTRRPRFSAAKRPQS